MLIFFIIFFFKNFKVFQRFFLIQKKIQNIKNILKLFFYREKYESFLQSVSLLKDMDSYERNKIADALKTV